MRLPSRGSPAALAAHTSHLGLALFLAAVVAAQLAHPRLSPARHTISEFVRGGAGAIMSAGFACWALSLLACALLVLRSPPQRRLRLLVGGLLTLAAAGIVLLDAFPTQTVAGALPAREHWTTAGRLHDIGSGATTLALLAAATASTVLLRARRGYRRAVLALLAIGVAGSIVGLAIGASVGGLRQRLLVALAVGWQVLFAETLRRAGDDVPRTPPEG